MKEIKITKKIAQKVLEIVSKGLVKGLGKQEEGKMCVEAAVCFALGLPHGDKPPCVGSEVRKFKIALNDCDWSSNEVRAEGMKALAIAQLGSDKIDQDIFIELVNFECITKILPVIIKNGLKEDKDNIFCKEINKKLEPMLFELSKVNDYAEAKAVTREVWEIYTSVCTYGYRYESAFRYAYASSYASSYAYAYAYASSSSYAFRYASAYAKPLFNDKILRMTAQAGLDALIKLNSQGTKYLDLLDANKQA